MAISQAVCTSFKKELLQGVHNFTSGSGGGTTTTTGTGNTFKIALYTSSASLDATTTVYSASNQASGAGFAVPAANRGVLVLNFGADKASSSGDFTITFPTADSSSAIIRIA